MLPRFYGRILATIVSLIAAFDLLTGSALAQSLPFGGTMPNVGAMSYNLMLSKGTQMARLRMTGYASSRGGIVRWIHCIQPLKSPIRKCRLMVNGKVRSNIPLPSRLNLRQWLASRFGFRRSRRATNDGGPSGAMKTSGQWRWGRWSAKGHFRYWR